MEVCVGVCLCFRGIVQRERAQSPFQKGLCTTPSFAQFHCACGRDELGPAEAEVAILAPDPQPPPWQG